MNNKEIEQAIYDLANATYAAITWSKAPTDIGMPHMNKMSKLGQKIKAVGQEETPASVKHSKIHRCWHNRWHFKADVDEKNPWCSNLATRVFTTNLEAQAFTYMCDEHDPRGMVGLEEWRIV